MGEKSEQTLHKRYIEGKYIFGKMFNIIGQEEKAN